MQATALTTKQYQSRLRAIGSCFTLVGKYRGMSTKQPHRCKDCDVVSDIKPCNVVHRKQGCGACRNKRPDRRKTLAEYVAEYPKLKRWRLLSKLSSVPTEDGLKVQCRTCNGVFEPTIQNLARGSGCPHCSGRSPWTWERFKVHAKQKRSDIKLKRVDIRTADSAVTFKCPHHGVMHSTVAAFLKSPAGCKQCSIERQKDGNRLTQNEFIETIKAIHGDALVYDNIVYRGMHEPVTLTCPVHGEFTKSCAKEVVHQQQGCPRCRRVITRPHQLVNDMLDGMQCMYKTNDRSQLEGLEIDSFIPEKRLGIEVHGLWWHSDKYVERGIHQVKARLAADRGIRLLQFWDSEIFTKPKIVRSMIAARLGRSKRVFARQTEVHQIDASVIRKFLDATHLQGAGVLASAIGYGLKKDGKLLMLMVFCKSRFDKNYEWEIYRISTRLGHVVVGGASKLLSHFVNEHKPASVLSYADARYSAGDVYRQLGFEHLRDTKPGYFYTNGSKRVSRFSARKLCADHLESEHMEQLGFVKVHDAGNSVWGCHFDQLCSAG